ncbi:MAG: hypothetical protein VKL39_09435 [Leptolyngbyaceae bacterium]|nr:hypothetical protein [Leptolyngbyaceae bacterium]
MNEFDLALFSSLMQVLPQILSHHPCGLYELAQEAAQQIHAPVQDVLVPFNEALTTLKEAGKIYYDRDHNQLSLQAS